jgi:single-strand DNA-binding protein
MDHINQVILQGFLPRDARITPNKRGGQCAFFTVATTKKWVDRKTGEQKSKSQYHGCTIWSADPDTIDFLKKSANVRVEGEIEYSEYDDKETGQKKYRTSIIVDSVEFKPADRSEPTAQRSTPQPAQDQQSPPSPVDDSDLPF